MFEKNISFGSKKIRSQARETVDDVFEKSPWPDQLDLDLKRHNDQAIEIFSNISALVDKKNEALVFEIFRDNYVFRTESTYRSICQTLGSAMAEPRISPYTLMALRDTIREELGRKYGTDTHQNLMFDSFSLHGQAVFGLEQVDFLKIVRSQYLTDETVDFRISQSRLYGSADHGIVLGAFFAQESAAETMLKQVREIFFAPFYERYLEIASRDSVDYYFNAHLDGTEIEHASRSKLCVAEYLSVGGSHASVYYGASNLWNKQLGLWRSILHKILSVVP